MTCFFPSPCGVLDLSVALISSKASQMTTALSNATSSGVPNDGATAFGSSAPLSILLVERQQRPLSAQYASRGRWIHSAGWAVGPLAELLLPPPLTVSPPPPLLPPLLPGDLTLPDHENQLDGRSGDERSDGLFKRTGGGFGTRKHRGAPRRRPAINAPHHNRAPTSRLLRRRIARHVQRASWR